MLNMEGMILTWNRGAQELMGFSAQEVIGKHFASLREEAVAVDRAPGTILSIAALSGIFKHEGWNLKKDLSRFWADVVIKPVFDQDGSMIGFTNVIVDLSERQSARENLKRSEEQFRLLVQGVADYAIYMLDLDGNITSWNLGAQRIKGYSPHEIMGQHFSRFLTEEDRSAGEDQRALATVLRGETYEKEAWRIRKDGTRFWANVVIEPIHETNQTIIGFAKITRDITERREALLALDKTREALFQSQKLEALGKLTGGVAHDFNNLLGAVLGSLEMARKLSTDRARLIGLIDNAIEAAQRGATLTRRMLAFARRQELQSEPINVMTLVAGMTHLLQQSLGPDIVVTTRFPLTIPMVKADGNQLELALLNLAVNARDAMPKGGEVVITAREQVVTTGSLGHLAPGRYVCLCVIDNGTGMDEITLARCSEPFFTTKGVGKGTGLGLSVVYGMLEQLGGRLNLRSVVGTGTAAEIWLPIMELPVIERKVKMLATAEPSPSVPHLTVIAVDDDSVFLKSTVAMLEDLGHTVFNCSSGNQALDLVRADRSIDLVITDHGMPHMTGFQLIRLLREDFPGIPVILASGYAELSNAEVVSVPKLSKPFGQQALGEAIVLALTTKQPHLGAASELQARNDPDVWHAG